MGNILWVGLGSAIGGMVRYWLSGVVAQRFGETFPWGTILVNVTGCFVVGAFATLTGTEGRWLATPTVRQFVIFGILGGYTTFSAFSLQTLHLAREGEWLWAGANILLSVVLCLVAVYLGHVTAETFNK